VEKWSSALLLPGTYGEALAAALTAASQNVATVLGGHAQTKTMGTSARGIARLKCTLHVRFPASEGFSERRAKIENKRVRVNH
tara:strand:- start:10017 stop:10265 length:249 start_codon:yes stop_codon:yes gene_type:complete